MIAQFAYLKDKRIPVLQGGEYVKLESVRRHYLVQYDKLVTGSVPVEEGHLTAPETPGLGIDLKPELLNTPGIEIETIGG